MNILLGFVYFLFFCSIAGLIVLGVLYNNNKNEYSICTTDNTKLKLEIDGYKILETYSQEKFNEYKEKIIKGIDMLDIDYKNGKDFSGMTEPPDSILIYFYSQETEKNIHNLIENLKNNDFVTISDQIQSIYKQYNLILKGITIIMHSCIYKKIDICSGGPKDLFNRVLNGETF